LIRRPPRSPFNPKTFAPSPIRQGPATKIRFALSALPPPLRADATVYVLDTAKGYVLDYAGTNGQSCFVSRTEWKFADYRDDIYDATCYDAVGAKNHEAAKIVADESALVRELCEYRSVLCLPPQTSAKP
jgi:hypothetical protein